MVGLWTHGCTHPRTPGTPVSRCLLTQPYYVSAACFSRFCSSARTLPVCCGGVSAVPRKLSALPKMDLSSIQGVVDGAF